MLNSLLELTRTALYFFVIDSFSKSLIFVGMDEMSNDISIGSKKKMKIQSDCVSFSVVLDILFPLDPS